MTKMSVHQGDAHWLFGGRRCHNFRWPRHENTVILHAKLSCSQAPPFVDTVYVEDLSREKQVTQVASVRHTMMVTKPEHVGSALVWSQLWLLLFMCATVYCDILVFYVAYVTNCIFVRQRGLYIRIKNKKRVPLDFSVVAWRTARSWRSKGRKECVWLRSVTFRHQSPHSHRCTFGPRPSATPTHYPTCVSPSVNTTWEQRARLKLQLEFHVLLWICWSSGSSECNTSPMEPVSWEICKRVGSPARQAAPGQRARSDMS